MSDGAPPAMGGLTRLSRNLSLAALLSLALLLVAWYGWLATPALSFWPLLLALFLLPLVIPMRGMLYGVPRSHIQAGLLALIYFVHGVMEIYGAPAERWLAVLEVALSLVLFTAGLAFARLRRRELGTRA